MSTHTETYKLADNQLEINPQGKEVLFQGEPVGIPLSGFELIELLARYPDTVLSPSLICQTLYKNYSVSVGSYLKVAICNLRSRLQEVDLGNPQTGVIRTRIKLGYVGVSVLADDEYLWQESHQRILKPTVGHLAINLSSKAIKVDENPPKRLEAMQYELLQYMAINEGIILTTNQILEFFEAHSWSTTLASLAVAVSGLRKALGPKLGHRDTGLIQTERGIGYRFAKSLS